MDKELVFVLNTEELRNAGFIGSFNDFADELAEEDYIVSGSYDDNGAPVITIVGIEQDTLETALKDHGIDDPSEFTEPVEAGEATPEDLDAGAGEGEEGDHADDGAAEPDPDEDEVDIIEDEDDPIIDHSGDDGDIDDEDIDVNIDLGDDDNDDNDDDGDDIPDDIDESKEVVFPVRGTQNISESLITKILADVKDTFLTKRIKDRVDTLTALKESADSVKINLNSWSNAKVNGVEIWKYRNVDILDLLSESKKSYREVYKKFKSLNESMTNDKKKEFVKVLKKQKALIEMLESEYRFRNLNEDITIDSSSADVNASGDEGQTQEESTQEATLTSIVFKVKNADEFIKVLTDHGIPSEALKKGSTTPDDGSDGSDQQDDQAAQPAADAGMGAAPAAAPAPAPAAGGNPFESLTTPLTKKNKLNEDGNPFDQLAGPQTAPDANLGDPDQPGPADAVDPLASEESADAGEGEEVILTDTSYASKVQQILADVYGYEKEKFEEKIGGEIVDEDGSDAGDQQTDDNPFNEIDGSDGSDAAGDEDDEDVGIEDSVSPEDLFGNI